MEVFKNPIKTETQEKERNQRGEQVKPPKNKTQTKKTQPTILLFGLLYA